MSNRKAVVPPVPSLDRLRWQLMHRDGAMTRCRSCGKDGDDAYFKMKSELERERAAFALTRLHENREKIAPYDAVRRTNCEKNTIPPHDHLWEPKGIYVSEPPPGMPPPPPVIVELFACARCGEERILSDDTARGKLASILSESST